MKFFLTLILLLNVLKVEAQNYEWRPIIPGIDCTDSSYNTCAIGLLVPDTFHNVLWMLGRFEGAAGISSSIAVGYDGTNWVAFPGAYGSSRFSNTLCAMMYNGNLVVGKSDGVDMFDFVSHSWTTIGIGVGSCLGTYNGDLIVGGNGIARWDGTQWYPLGNGITGSNHVVYCTKEYNGKLYAGGLV